MKKLIASILIMLSLTFTGCTLTNTQSSVINVLDSAITADYIYSQGNLVDYIGNSKLSTEDMDLVVGALVTIDEERQLLKKYKEDPTLLLRSIYEVRYNYLKIKDAYITIKEVIERNKDLYSSDQIVMFTEFDTSVTLLDKEFNELLAAVKADEAISTAISITETVIKIGSIAL